MAEQNPIPGKFGLLYRLEDSTVTPLSYRPLACLTSTEFSPSRDVTTEDATKCDPDNPVKTLGPMDLEITADGKVFDTDDTSAKDSWKELYDIMKAGTLENFKYDTNTEDTASKVFYFKAYITSLPLTQEANTSSTFSITLNVVGGTEEVEPTFS